MDKQTCIALLNLLGFTSYDITYNEWLTDFKLQAKRADNLFLLKSIIVGRVGSIVNGMLIEHTFQSYNTMIKFAREIHEAKTRRN